MKTSMLVTFGAGMVFVLVGLSVQVAGDPPSKAPGDEKVASQGAATPEAAFSNTWCPLYFYAGINNIYYHVGWKTNCMPITYVPAARLHTCASCPQCPDPIMGVLLADPSRDDTQVAAIRDFIPPRQGSIGDSNDELGKVRITDPRCCLLVDDVAVVPGAGAEPDRFFRIFKIQHSSPQDLTTPAIMLVGQELRGLPDGSSEPIEAEFTEDRTAIVVWYPNFRPGVALGDTFQVLMKTR